MPKRKQGEVDNQGAQDFELIELLIRESVASTSAQRGSEGMFKKVCQAAFLVQLNFQSVGKEDVKLRHS